MWLARINNLLLSSFVLFQIDPKYLNLTGLVADGVTEDFAVLMTELTRHIYSYQGVDQGRIRTRSMLCHIYHHALHDRWFQARDLMLMSHLQESIQHSDVETQVCGGRPSLLLVWADVGVVGSGGVNSVQLVLFLCEFVSVFANSGWCSVVWVLRGVGALWCECL